MSVIQTNFSNPQLAWIILSLILGLVSIIFFIRKDVKLSLLFLFFSGLILRFVAAGLDPFLNTWDEQFHALVAKNMMADPFKPMLVGNPVLDYNFRDWTSNHIWLHKQPWFLWQIALSFKIFGLSEYSLRLPTALMFSAMILIIYRIGKLLGNPGIAWYGAFLYSFSGFFISFVSGSYFTDHNDSAFIFYVSLSLWAWTEYMFSGKRKWLLWIGLFAGIAILNKWLAGLMVYAAWLMVIGFRKGIPEKFRELKRLSISLLVAFLMALPWQLFVLWAYPLESRYEYSLNSLHFFKAMETHSESIWYHFRLLPEQYGGLMVGFIVLPGLYYFFREIKDRAVRLGLLFMLVFVYLFFTVAATKMPMFCTITAPLIFLGIGAALDQSVCWLQKNIPGKIFPGLMVFLLFLLAYLNLDLNHIDEIHSVKQPYWKTRMTDAVLDKQVASILKNEDCVVFNCGGYNTIMFMFYSGKTAYGAYPDSVQYQTMKKKGIRLAIFMDENSPPYLRNESGLKKIFTRSIPF